ncbi:MAG TPA: FtsH protease activity modulator HflK [Propylenella sp.]|nr:FtsH protease activity modulator HflK [Propylenella sp.]
MPWNNNPGGGGPWKSGGGGPWGSGPQQRGPQPPDLEELLRRSQDRLRNVMPAGGRGNVLIAVLVVAALAVLWVANSVYMIQPDELGQELVFGKPKEQVAEPGLHFIFWPVETVEKVSTRVQREYLGSDDSRRAPAEGNLMLSADQNIVEINFSVLWRVSDPKRFLFNVNEPQGFLRRVAESAMRELVGRSTAEQVRTERRAEVEEGVRALVQGTLDAYDAGISLVGVQLERADPPTEVADAFEEVQRAQQDLDRFQREAEQYANRRLGDARGEAAQVTEQAIGYRQQVVAQAEGESQRFLAVLTEYEQAEDVTRERLFLETMERVLQSSNKIILDQEGGPGVLPYLPLDQLQRNQTPVMPRTPSQATGTPNPTPRVQAPEVTQ